MKKPVNKIKMCAPNEGQTEYPKKKLNGITLKSYCLNKSICNPIPIDCLIKSPYCYATKNTPKNIIVNLTVKFEFLTVFSHFLF